MCSVEHSPSGENPGPVQSARGPTVLVGATATEPDPTDRPTAAAAAELTDAVAAWLATGGPTAADLAMWSKVFRSLEESEWPAGRWTVGPDPAAAAGTPEGGGL